ncbi:uncharacterized protein BDR25DRAFT_371940 [Lindgomyces ingoldianus]|uniref:Uncharacterized protein n=1 Tax=Lindgomyces ingoldianus TaxID=673940 RepID=A0ACB6QTF8_9PLEO|nr:uncharacterized protein BDR25DRAFT_371940 [Lindgomyces ingoldianus]KAF2469385.1 hypothetical protein BDR25DRAFT_371940 [Lindgomyces ingoldianus]
MFHNLLPRKTVIVPLLLNWSGLVTSIVAPPDTSYWRAPYALRVISDDARINGRTLVPDTYNGRTTGVYINSKRAPHEAYTIYPSGDPWASSFNYSNLTELYEQQFHSDSNSTELILIYGQKPPTASGTPLLLMNTDTGPGVTHLWPAASFVVDWRSWRFVWDETNERAILRNFGWTDGMRWIAYQGSATGSTFYIYRWNGTLPRPSDGWGSSVSDIVNASVNIDLEVVPLWQIPPLG